MIIESAKKRRIKCKENEIRKIWKKVLDKQKLICYNTICCGASPSGKASDSDSDISGVRIPVPQPKNPKNFVLRIFSFVPTGTTSFAWHKQHHLTVRSTSLPLAAQMNEVEALPQMMLQQVANDVMLRINDVALCTNEIVAARLDCR